MHRIKEIRRFDHVVLLIAAQSVLRSEGGGEPNVGQGGERVETVTPIGRDRGRMRKQRDPTIRKWFAQCRILQQAIDSETHHAPSPTGQEICATKLARA